MTNKDPMQRVFALGKLNRILKVYTDSTKTAFDRRLLKGFYINDNEELENDSEKEIRELTEIPYRHENPFFNTKMGTGMKEKFRKLVEKKKLEMLREEESPASLHAFQQDEDSGI